MGRSLFGSFCKNANFKNANLTNTDLESVDFDGADLTNAQLAGSQVRLLGRLLQCCSAATRASRVPTTMAGRGTGVIHCTCVGDFEVAFFETAKRAGMAVMAGNTCPWIRCVCQDCEGRGRSLMLTVSPSSRASCHQ